jgi:hypothetical protein
VKCDCESWTVAFKSHSISRNQCRSHHIDQTQKQYHRWTPPDKNEKDPPRIVQIVFVSRHSLHSHRLSMEYSEYPGVYHSTGYYSAILSPNTAMPYPTSSWPGIQTAPATPRPYSSKMSLPPINTKVHGGRIVTSAARCVTGYDGVRSDTEFVERVATARSLQRTNANHRSVGRSGLLRRARAACQRSQHGFKRRNEGYLESLR